jgi:hypothetical protein
MGLKDSYRFTEFVRAIWPRDEVYEHDGITTVKAVRDKIDNAVQARRYLGDAAPRLRATRGWVILKRGTHKATNTDLSTDADEFHRLTDSTDPGDWRTAVNLVEGPIGKDLPMNGWQQEWFDEQQELHANAVRSLLEKLFPSHPNLDQLAIEVFAGTGIEAIGPGIGITVPRSIDTVPRTFSSINWEELGVTPAAVGLDRLPDYLPRSIDHRLDDALQRAATAQQNPSEANQQDRFVILTGPSKYGKTRAFYEAVRRHDVFPHQPTLTPQGTREATRDVETAGTANEPLLLWLDDMDGYCAFEFETQGVTPSQLCSALTRNPRLVVLATAGGKGRLRIRRDELADRLGRPWQEILSLAAICDAPTTGADARDVSAAQKAGWSKWLVRQIEDYGLGATLSAGPDLVHTLETARDTDDHYGWALVTAVGLLQQEQWFVGAIPERVARAAWLALVDETLIASSQDTAWAAALAFATRPVRGEARLAYHQDSHINLHDYVLPHIKLSGRERLRTLDEAVSAMTTEECRAIGQMCETDLAAVGSALRLAREGISSIYCRIWQSLLLHTNWPTDNEGIEACARLACLVLDYLLQEGHTTVVINSMSDIPDPVFDLVCKHLGRTSNADLAVSALRIMRDSPADGDYSRLVASASHPASPHGCGC